MTAENNGVPEDDDPFAYLYRTDGEAAGSEAPTQQHPGVPRTSYAQATQVGRTQWGGGGQTRQQPQGYGYPQQQPPGSQPTQAMPNQRYTPPPGGGRAAARSGSGGSKGVAIGAVAVVIAIVIGIGVAMFTNGGKSKATAGSSASTSASAGQSNDTASASASASAASSLPMVADAAGMQISGAGVNNEHTGAKAAGGKFVETMSPGASITWTVNAPSAGQYQLWIRYANAGGDTSATVTTDGTAKSINLKNYTPTSDWNKAWYYYWTIVKLNAGSNTIVLSSAAGQGNYNVDQLALTNDCNTSGCKPSTW